MKKKQTRVLVSIMAAALLITNMDMKGITDIGRTLNVYGEESNVSGEEDYTQYVNPFVGTDVDYGQLFPGAVVPNGLVKLSPDTYPHNTDDHAGYDYSKTQIEGFSHTRIEGVGGQGAGGDILITPTYVQYDSKPSAASRAQNYSHDKETATPGYYSVELTPKTGTGTNYKDDTAMGNIKAEMTSNTWTGYHKYTFPKDGKVSLVVDLNYTYHGTDIRNAILNVEQQGEYTAISGRFSGKNVSGHGKYTMYFYMETSVPAEEVKTWLNSDLTLEADQEGNDIGAVLTFEAKASEPIEVKVSVSPVSSAQAKKDMYQEMSGWDFNAVYEDAKAAWNEVLGKVKVENSAASDPDGRLKKLFYTHLYHMFTTPVNATSTDNTFRATNLKLYSADDYTHYDSWTLWDDFRKYPVIGLVQPETYKDYIRSIADTMEYGIGTWGLDTQTVPTVRTEHAVALLADGVAKGFDDIDNLEAAYEKAKEIADSTVNSTAESLGYIEGRVDKTVEYSYDDWAISLLAKNLNNSEDYNKYLKRSFFYKNLFKADAVTTTVNGAATTFGLLWPKDASGNFKSADPEAYGNNSLYQGTLWQYTWWDSNDVNGLMDLMGSKEKMAEALQYLYGMQDSNNGSRMLHTNSNEIDLQTPYLFNYVGEPYNTQYWVRKIYTDKTWNRYSGTGEYNPPLYDYVYKLDPQGFLETMDDDAGTMASMYVAAAMGLFPMAPGDTTYQIGTPFFDKITIDVGNGKEFVIKANNVSSENYYIQSAALNGENFNRTWIDYSEIIRGGTLSFEMGGEPSDWATDSVTALSSSDLADTSVYDAKDNLSYSQTTLQEAEKNDGSIEDSVTISLQNTDALINGAEGEDLLSSGKVKVENVPNGLSVSAVKLNDTSLRLNFTGNAVNHRVEDSIGNVSVQLADSLFTKTITSSRKEKNLKLMFQDDTITLDKDRLYETSGNDGALEGKVTLQLSGDSSFSGNDGDDFIAAGKLYLSNLPEGLTASAVKINDKQLSLELSGKAAANDADADDLGITFQDSAFQGAKACDINGSNYGGMQSLILDFTPNWDERLAEIIEEGRQVDSASVTTSSYRVLETALEYGQELLDKGTASEEELEAAYMAVLQAMDGLVYSQNGLKQLEAENYTIWSGGKDLKTETNQDSSGTSLGNLGGTYDGAWIGFEKLNFGSSNVASFTVRYVNNTNRCATDAAIEIHLGSKDGGLLQTVPLAPSGNNWNAYTTKSVELTNGEKLTGIVDLYFVLRGTGAAGSGSGQVYVANIDWIKFNAAASYGKYQAESYSTWSGGNLKTENSTSSEGESLTNIGATYDGAWISYNQILFNGEGLGKVGIRYANNSGRCGDNARIEVRLDGAEGQLVDTIYIPASAGDWTHYVTVEKEITSKVTGLHDVYLVIHATTTSSKPYVANIDWFSFTEAENQAVDKQELQELYDSFKEILSKESEYEPVSFAAFKAALEDAEEILKADTVTKEEVEQAIRNLKEKKGALVLLNTEVVLESLSISKQPDKTIYNLGESIDTTGMEVTASYSDGTTKTVTDYILENTIAERAGSQEVKVSYQGKECSFTIIVLEEQPDSIITPNSVIFDKNKESADYGDKTITVADGYTAIGIKYNGQNLSGEGDYTVTGSAITFSADYLEKLETGIRKLDIEFQDGQSVPLKVYVLDTTPVEATEPEISPLTAIYDKYTKSSNHKDVLVTMTLNGNTLSSIKNETNKGKVVVLTEGKDYKTEGNTVTIYSAYLDKQGKGVINLSFDFSLGYQKTLEIRIVNTKPSSGSSGSSGSGGSTGNSADWVTTIVADNGSSKNQLIQIPVTRNLDEDGDITDKVQYEESQAAKTVQGAMDTNSTRAIIDTTGNPHGMADRTEIILSAGSTALLGNNKIELMIAAGQADVLLPAGTLAEMRTTDARLKLSAVKKEEEIGKVQEILSQFSSGAAMLHSPVNIETNYSLHTQITIPIKEADLPADRSKMQEFTSALAVLVQHSDGEVRLQKGTIEYDALGIPTGISVWVDKFSTFTLVKTNFNGTVKVLKNKQMPDKDLQVSFGEKLDPATVTADSVYVLDSKGNMVITAIECKGNGIKVIPEKQYTTGETYSFYITGNVHYKSGKPIEKPRKYVFTIGNVSLGNISGKVYDGIPKDKIWQISLNKNVTEESIKTGQIKVIDQCCVEKKSTLSVKNGEIQIKPQKPYESGNTYYIVISGITYADGTVMENTSWIKFRVK